ncbi:MAG: hypothetical protein ABI992_13805, partial [Chthoniobacterales bacterium]
MPSPVNPRPLRRRLLLLVKWSVLLGLLLVGGANCWIQETTRRAIFIDTVSIPANDVGLVLGTSRAVGNFANPFFGGRMDAAAALYREGKIRHL